MPRRIIGGAFVSIDGVMQAPGGPEEDPTGGFSWGGWLTTMFDEALGHQIDTLFNGEFELLLGRRTYDIFTAHWPFMPDEDPLAAKLNRIRKHVLTSCEKPFSWQGSSRVADMAALAALKETDGPDLVIQGSSTLYPQLLEHGLLDRLVLMTAPVVLGGGKRLFGDGTPDAGMSRTFRLIETRLSSSGIVMTTYEPAGRPETGTFEMDKPSERELNRRARIARGEW